MYLRVLYKFQSQRKPILKKKAKFLSAFAKLRITIIIFVKSACLSVRPSAWNNSAPTGWIFMKFDI